MSDQIPKVSVLIPAYNAERFIERTIKSALNQTFSELEIIVLDDGSKDDTGRIVKAMQEKDPRIKYFYQENQGLSQARNRLVELSGGEFLAFLDHDDEWLPQKTEKQLQVFGKDKTMGLVFSDFYRARDGKNIGTSFKERKPSRGYVFFKYLFSDNFVPLITAMVPKNILLEFMPFNPHYEVSEEFDMFLKISWRYKFDYLDEPLAIYHIHGDNTVILKWEKLIKEEFAILESWLKKDPSIRQLYRHQLNKRISQLYSKEGFYFLNKRNTAKVIGCIFKSFSCNLFNLNAVKLGVKLMLNVSGFKDIND